MKATSINGDDVLVLRHEVDGSTAESHERPDAKLGPSGTFEEEVGEVSADVEPHARLRLSLGGGGVERDGIEGEHLGVADARDEILIDNEPRWSAEHCDVETTADRTDPDSLQVHGNLE